MDLEEKKNQRKGIIISLGIHSALLVLFLFVLAWSPPDPPIPEYGIELNFGFDASGSGDNEILDPSESDTENESETEKTDEQVEETTEDTSEEIPTEDTDSEVIPNAVESNSDFEDVNSPDKVEDKIEKTPTIKKEEVKEPVKPVEKPKEKPKALITYPSGGGKSGEGNKEGTGNMGDPSGSKEAINYTGTPGGGGGASLDMSGWKWDKRPIPDDDTDATGKIIFEIEVDEYGIVNRVKTIEKTVSPRVEQLYRDEILKTTFSKTSAGSSTAARSVGRITYILRSQ